MKFATKLIALILIFIVISGVVISFFVYTSNIKTLEKEITDRLEDKAFDIIDKIDRNLYERYSDIQMMAIDPIISSRDSTPKQITERLIEYRNIYKSYASLSFFDLNRIRIADTAGLGIGEQHTIVKYWEDVLQGKISAAADVRSPLEGLKIPVIYFASPVKDKNGETFGVVVSRMPITRLYEITKPPVYPYVGEEKLGIDLVDRKGLLLYSSINKKGILKDNYAAWEDVKSSMAGEKIGSLIYWDSILKEEHFLVFVPEQGHLDFEGNDWTLLVHIPTKFVFAPAIKLRNDIIIILFVTIIITSLLVFIFSKTLTKPITKLKESAEEISKGNLENEIKISSKDEIGDLAGSFETMRTEMKSSRENLEKEINKKTKDLQSRVSQLERFKKLTVGRELRMMGIEKENEQLKEEVNGLKKRK